jgi:hypothetical protein
MDRFNGRESSWSQTDNTTSDGWMNKSNFHDACLTHFNGYRELVKILIWIRAKPRLASEWIPGDTSKVADSLSRDTDLSDADLITLICVYIPLQLPHFDIRPLPTEISSLLTSLLQKLPAPKESPNRPIRSQLRLSSVANPMSARSTMTTIYSHLSREKNGGKSLSFRFRPSRWAIQAWQAQSKGASHKPRHPRRCGTDRHRHNDPGVDERSFYVEPRETSQTKKTHRGSTYRQRLN